MGGQYLDGGVPLVRAVGFPHAVVEHPHGGLSVVLLRHLHLGVLSLLQLGPFLSGALLPPAHLREPQTTQLCTLQRIQIHV